MVIRANCKINLGLFVTRRREDGYHELQTVMLPVRGLYDVVDVERMEREEREGVQFECCGIEVDCSEDKNLCVRAARLMQEHYDVGGVAIKLDKRVPFGAGLGGGSSDATAVIVAVNELYNLGLDKPTLASLAAELGSDTPFFVYNTPQLCTGRGEIMSPVAVDLRGLWLAVAKPVNEGVSTKEAYSGIKPMMPTESLVTLLERDIGEWQGSVVNDFEPHIFAAHPTIKVLKQKMLDAGAVYAAMSGSGSAVFGLFTEQPHLTLGADTFLHVEHIE